MTGESNDDGRVEPGTGSVERTDRVRAAERLLQSLADAGVANVFSNLGTDHTPLLEATARLRAEDPELYPRVVVCPHEFAAMSAAHGYAAVTDDPQAVLVHVDVGTQTSARRCTTPTAARCPCS